MLVDKSAAILPSSITESPVTPYKGDVLNAGENQPLTPSLKQEVQDRLYDPEFFAHERQLSTPEISQQTKNTCADVLVMQYQSILDVTAPAAGSWEENFQTYFESQFTQANPGKDPKKATAQELSDFAKTLSEKDQYQVWAIKIAEEQQLLLEASTGLKNEPQILPEKTKYVARDYAIGRSGVVEEAEKAHIGVNATSLPERILARIGLGPNANKIQQAAMAERVMEYTASEFKEEGKKQDTYIGSATFESTPLYNETVTINGNFLTDSQKAFLRRMAQVPNASEIQVVAQERISNYVNSINAARLNFYAHHDRQLVDRQDFNFLVQEPGNPNEFKFNAKSNQPQLLLSQLGYEVVKGAPPQVIEVGISGMGVKTQIDIIQQQLKNELNNVLTETVDKTHAQTTRDVIQTKIDELSAEKGKPLNKTAEEQLDKAIGELQAQLAVTEEVEAKEKEYDDEIKRKTDEKDKVKSDAGVDTKDETNYSNLLTKKQELAQKELKLNIAKQNYKDIAERLTQIPTDEITDFENGKPKRKRSEYRTGYETLIDDLKRQLKEANDAISTASGEKSSVESDIFNLESLLPKAKQEALQQMNTLQSQIDQQTREKADYRKKRVTKMMVDPTNATKQLDAKAVKAALEAKTNEKNGTRFNERFIQQQIDAYTELKGRMDPDTQEAIQHRAMQPIDNKIAKANLELARKMYPNVPPAYLRTLQILYGPEVTTLTAKGKEMYEKAMRLLPPEKFIELLKAKNPALAAITNVYDTVSLLANEISMLQTVDDTFISTTLEELRTQALTGTLGKVSDTEKNGQKNVAEKVTADDFAASTLVDKDKVVDQFGSDIYSFTSVEDLTLKIQQNEALYALTLTDAQRKMVAEEIIKRKKKI